MTERSGWSTMWNVDGRRFFTGVACSAAALAAVMVVSASWLHWLNGAVDTAGLDTELLPGTALQTLAWAVAGVLIATKRPRNPFGWLFCGAGLAQGMTALGYEYAVAALSYGLPGGAWVFWLASWTWVLHIGVIPIVLLLFPDGRLLSRPWGALVGLALTATAALLVSQALRPGSLTPDTPALLLAFMENPVGIAGMAPAFDAVNVVSSALLDLVLVAGVVSLMVRFRRARGDERQQLKWLASVAVFLPVTIAVTNILPGMTSTLAFKVHMALLIGTITVAVLKYRLYDIDLIINRSLVYGTSTVLVLGLYVAVVAFLGAVLRTQASVGVSLVATGVVAAAFSPLRIRLQRAVDQLMYGERHEPYEVISRLGQRLEATLAPDQVLPRVVETVAQALKLPYVAVEVRQADAVRTVASHGQTQAEALRLPLRYQGELVGHLVLAARNGDEGFTPVDRRLLGDLARQAGVAAHAVALTAALQRSRELLVAAREEERRRMRRDLHDGLGPALTAVTLKIDATRNVLEDHPDAADALLGELRAETKAAIQDIRRLVYDLRPPALDELGLVGALCEQAASFVRGGAGQLDGLRVSVEAPDELPPLPAAVEVAAYRIGAEAVTNVARHANAGHCVLRLSVNGALEVEVTDDGVGATASWRPGVGLSSMHERAAELGGTCTVGPDPRGGTRVHARLPL
ncbi:MAG: GAF domain-containing sensor histidine kinase [Pseudonocardia sp.]